MADDFTPLLFVNVNQVMGDLINATDRLERIEDIIKRQREPPIIRARFRLLQKHAIEARNAGARLMNAFQGEPMVKVAGKHGPLGVKRKKTKTKRGADPFDRPERS